MTDRWGGRSKNLTWRQLRDIMVGSGRTEVGKPRHLRLVTDTTEPPPPTPSTPAAVNPTGHDGYAELHAHSYFSFLDGASSPEDLVTEALRLGLSGLAITDHDGLYGAVRFSQAAKDTSLSTVYGAELSLGLSGERTGVPDPSGTHLLTLARGPNGYAKLSATIGNAQLAGGQKGLPDYGSLEDVAAALRDEVLVLTGCRKGPVRRALADGPDAVRRELERLKHLFGPEGVAVELTDHRAFVDTDHNQLLFDLATDLDLPVVATNNVHYARAARHRLSQVMSAIRANLPLEELDGWLPAAPVARLCSPSEMAERFAPFPGAVANTVRLTGELAFDLDLIAPALPPFPVPDGHDEASWLRELAREGALRLYGTAAERPEAYRRLEHELDIITNLGFPGYFLIVRDIVGFCEENRILVQGRGSAVTSVVCYCLGITAVDPVRYNLLFERFMSPIREGPPDIDLDIEARRREEVIQYVFTKYGRTYAAQVANVISYRRRSATRDVATALGHSPGQIDAWSANSPRRGGPALDELPTDVGTYAGQLLGAPRHLGIHSGGMVICDRPVIEVVPVEHARMENRTVLQWDKDDCADAGLVKFDLLGLGMLTALHEAADLANTHYATGIDLKKLAPTDPDVYAMIHAGDSVGTFQIESRAQIQLAPRLRAENLHDLAVQIALVRPGPIQGGAVHPYVRRRRGEEPIEYPHPTMEAALKRTLGVPLFQEQMMALASDCAGFSAAEADELRQAMGAKRSVERMQRLKSRFLTGAAANDITGPLADDLWSRLEAFSGYGFPESHAISFAYIAYASAYLKRYYPAAFLVGLIRAQPMGFYSVNTLIADARRHGVTVHAVHINHSSATTTLDQKGAPALPETTPATWGAQGPTVRLGLDQIRGINTETAERIVRGQPYTDISQLARRAEITTTQLENLATSGALADFGLTRRQALWTAAPAAANTPDTLDGTTTLTPPTLPGMSAAELTAANLHTTNSSPTTHPITHIRHQLAAHGAIPIHLLSTMPDKSRVTIGGLVTHRQAPETAHGVLFLNLEDETGHANIVCPTGLRLTHPRPTHTAPALLIRGRLENHDGARSITADKLTPLQTTAKIPIRDFR
ncbi:error-prone DNA polymerase [Stackebrandtia nassauensis]|uniref:Error-prone DNA polymerase n=1 Tax=Stackebrandtia nassauensis (strain DSM 44728 / CIP 108903 / NRRL B-16338 / NBRC 102104 / LLR-40K-21) TaxID=446470 RepID=D3Q9D7_STANL|nr:error-prone DNA polymerase [Stackebrandtia nassauensis]ADD42619.1 DNA polymerase III, alpha subunit [Stackebrandtia nassauensis DSM 44728]